MAKQSKNKFKRNKILASGLITFLIAALAIGVGVYIGFITLDYNYITIGTMQRNIVSLFLCSSMFVALGVVAISLGIKLLSISSSTNFAFFTKKSILITSLVFYAVIVILSISSVCLCFVTVISSAYRMLTFVLAGISIGLSVLCFFFVFKELKKFLKKIKNGEIVIQIEYPRKYIPATDTVNMAYAKKEFQGTSMDLDGLQSQLSRLDEMRSSGLINDQEYQQLKKHWIERMNSRIF